MEMSTIRRRGLWLAAALSLALGFADARLHAQAAAPAPAPAAPAGPSLDQRVSDLEQYFQNLAPGGSGQNTWASKIAGVPGPGHNAWLMVSAALVLFMT